jgi:hypothetical protein
MLYYTNIYARRYEFITSAVRIYAVCVFVNVIYLELRWWISFGEKRIGILILFFFVRFDYLLRNL